MSTTTKTNKLTVSASQFELYARAPRAWWARHVLRLPDPKKTTPLLTGTAFHAVMERWQKGEADLYPAGWLDGLTPADGSIIKSLASAVIDAKIVTRGVGHDVEGEFRLPLLDAEGDLPAVEVMGYSDVLTPTGVDDFKTTKSLDYAKSPAEIKTNIQLNVYAKVWLERRRERGDWETDARLRLIYAVKSRPPEVTTRQATVTPEEIDAAWGLRKGEARAMRALRATFPAAPDAEAEARWFDVPCVVKKPSEMPYAPDRDSPCGAYGGCPLQKVCGGVENLAEYRKRVTATPEPVSEGASEVSVFAKRVAAAQAAGGAPPAQPTNGNGQAGHHAPAPAPATVPPAGAPHPAPTPAAKPSLPVLPSGAPWAQAGCSACVTPDKQHVSGIAMSGFPCMVCKTKAKKAGTVNPEMFEIAHDAGETVWECKPEFQASVPEGKRSGSYQVHAAPAAQAKPEAPAPAPATTPALASAPKAETAAAVAETSALPPAQAPAPTTATPTPTRERAKKGFTLCVGCVPVGAGNNVIRLEDVFVKHAARLAVSEKSESYWMLDRWKRAPALALQAEAIIAEEKFGTKFVVVDAASADFREFAEAMRAFADLVIVGTS